MNDILVLKEQLYDLLSLDDDDASGDSIVQKLNVSMTNAIQKQGVTIIPIQNAVQKKIVVKVVNILKQVDKMLLNGPPVPVTKEILDLSALCSTWAERNLSLDDVIKEIRVAYLQTLIATHGTKNKAAQSAGINVQTLFKYLKASEVTS